jgi:hypothetical protein
MYNFRQLVGNFSQIISLFNNIKKGYDLERKLCLKVLFQSLFREVKIDNKSAYGVVFEIILLPLYPIVDLYKLSGFSQKGRL